VIGLIILSSTLLYGSTANRHSTSIKSSTTTFPARCLAFHAIGKIGLSLNNGGRWGGWPYDTVHYGRIDCYLGENGVGGIEYPTQQRISIGSGAIWIGAVVENDTLVSVGDDCESGGNFEFFPDRSPFGEIRRRSTESPTAYASAISELDYIAEYADTFRCCVGGLVPDYFNERSHKPIPVAVTQRSYSWSNAFCDDFVLLDYTIHNIAEEPLKDVYIGFYYGLMAGYGYDHSRPYPGRDDICGYLTEFAQEGDCPYSDTFNLVWGADNDGDPINGQFAYYDLSRAVPNVVGIRLLGDLGDDLTISFNWWTENITSQDLDFGPNRRAGAPSTFRFGTGGNGVPYGDRNKYYLMRNGEIDYDVLRTSEIGVTNPIWEAPSAQAVNILKDGDWVDCLYSIGPFEIEAGGSLDIPLAVVGGENFHTLASNADNLQPGRIDQYMANVDFSDLVRNALNAEWVYDNPGYDSDSDGYAGKYRVCVLDSTFRDGGWVTTRADTTWYRGDGVPDWRALTPPIPPKFQLIPTLNGIRVQFNGAESETRVDPFTQVLDFEGYNIYIGRDEREASLSLAATYDREDYDKWLWDPSVGHAGDWVNREQPKSLDEWRCIYGLGSSACADTLFHPLNFDRSNPYRLQGSLDSIFYFTRHQSNTSQFGFTTPIRKVYPDEPPPPEVDVPPSAFTEEGTLKYYEYECTLVDLLPTVPYFINVTAFDFGFPEQSMPPLESSKLLHMKSAFPYADRDQNDSILPPVYVYPNPYRADDKYRDHGFEGRIGMERGQIDDRVRRINFVNLPPVCVIRIHTLDGDLVREIRHEGDPSDPNSTHDSWDLINRNIQAIESGIYYWSVEDQKGKVQIGKVVVIR
jgi:hypothetical protein